MKSLKIYVLGFLLTTPMVSLCNSTRFENLKKELAQNTQQIQIDVKKTPSLQSSVTCGVLCATASAIALSSSQKSTGAVLAFSTLAGLLAGRIFYLEKAKKINHKKLLTVIGSTFALSLGVYALHTACGSKPGPCTDSLMNIMGCEIGRSV